MPNIDLEATASFIAALSSDNGWSVRMMFQTFDDALSKRRGFARTLTGPLRQHMTRLARLNSEGACIAMAINALRSTRRIAANVSAIRALFVDCDGPLRRDLALPPSISVASRNGPHHYWLLQPGTPVQLFAAAQRHLAAYYGSDAAVSDPSRVMRLPGFLHRKGEPFLVRILEADATRRYTLGEILAAHTRSEIGTDAPISAPSSPDAMRAFRIWASAAPSICGSRNLTAYAMAAEGVRLGMPAADVERMVTAYCIASGIAGEAPAVLRSARKLARGPLRQS